MIVGSNSTGTGTLYYSLDGGTTLTACNGTPTGKNWNSVCVSGDKYVYAIERTTNTLWMSSNKVNGTFTQITTLATITSMT